MPYGIWKVAAFGDALVNEEKVAFLDDVRDWIGRNPALTGALVLAPIGAVVGAKTTPEEEPEQRMTRAVLGALLAGGGGALLGSAVLPKLVGTGDKTALPKPVGAGGKTAPLPSRFTTPAPSRAAATERVTGSPVRPAAAEPPSVSSRALTPETAEARLRDSERAIRHRAAQQLDRMQRQAIADREKAALMRDEVRTVMRTQQMLQPRTYSVAGAPRGFITITPGPGVQQIASPLMPTQTPPPTMVASAKIPGIGGGAKYGSLREMTANLASMALFKKGADESHASGSMAFGGLNTTGTETDTTSGEGYGETRSVMPSRPPEPSTSEEKQNLTPPLVPWPGARGVRVHAEDVR